MLYYILNTLMGHLTISTIIFLMFAGGNKTIKQMPIEITRQRIGPLIAHVRSLFGSSKRVCMQRDLF